MIINYVFWLAVPAAIQTTVSGFQSVVPNVTPAETTALQAGQIIEKQYSQYMSPGMTQALVGQWLVNSFNIAQAQQNLLVNGKNYATTYYDGTWHNVPA